MPPQDERPITANLQEKSAPSPCVTVAGCSHFESICKGFFETPGPSEAMARNPQIPSGRAEKRRAWGGLGHRRMAALRALTRCGCLSGAPSARSEFRSAAPCPSIAGCPQRSAGTRQVGSPFLCLLSFGEAKESRCAAGRTSRPATIPKDARAGNQTSVEQGFDKLSPNGRCRSSRAGHSGPNQPPAQAWRPQPAMTSIAPPAPRST